MIFCGDRVLVEAGEPVLFAVLDERAGHSDLVVGHSDLDRPHTDRPHGAGFFTAGPDRNARIACGRRSLAFGLGETSLAQESIARLGHEVRFGSEIVALSELVPAPAAAAELGVRACAQDIREIAWIDPDLRRAMPEVAGTSRARERTDLGSDTLLLRHFVGRNVPALRRVTRNGSQTLAKCWIVGPSSNRSANGMRLRLRRSVFDSGRQFASIIDLANLRGELRSHRIFRSRHRL